MKRRLPSWPILSLLALLGIAMVVLVVPGTCRRTADDVEKRIEDDLPIGADQGDIEGWIENEGLRVLSRGLVEGYSELRNEGLAPRASVIYTSMSAGREGLLSDRTIDIYFILSQDGKLIDFVVKEVATGL